ncbi:hypothetical protein [Streptomyces lannensis]|uniref:Uncharacterized protein n=1 Tax=Streptomyces lannensis TaxID=766498 RepID=A0ABP7KRT6_9ACTN
MITRPLPYSPYPRSSGERASGTRPADAGLIPFVTQREGEEAAPNNLFLEKTAVRQHRLRYQDEDPRDRDHRGVLWARCSLNPVDGRLQPTGAPQWKLMHPLRQRLTMQAMRCQVCAQPAKTPLGYFFLAGPHDIDTSEPPVLTSQPPVCAKHVRVAIRLCPHLRRDTTVFLARSAPLYGVLGVVYGYGYGYGQGGVHVVACPDSPLPYGHPNLDTFLASQLVRRLTIYRVVGLDELANVMGQVT